MIPVNDARAVGSLRARLLAGVGPVRSLRALEHLRTGVPGLHIPGEVGRRLRAVPADQVAGEGLRICTEIIEQIRQIPGVSGVRVMAPGCEQGIPAILDRAGLARPRPRDGGPQATGGFRGVAPTLGGASAD